MSRVNLLQQFFSYGGDREMWNRRGGRGGRSRAGSTRTSPPDWPDGRGPDCRSGALRWMHLAVGFGPRESPV